MAYIARQVTKTIARHANTTQQTFETEPTRQEQALTAAKRLYVSPHLPFYGSLYPFAAPIDGRKVSTMGLHRDCIRFEKQRRLVVQRGDSWPCVSISTGQADLVDGFPMLDVAPVDFGGLFGPKLRDLKSGDELDHIVSSPLERAGFLKVFTRSSDQALDAFISGIARVLFHRCNRLDDNARPDPPVLCTVTINTREDGRRIVYTKGYFISTQTAFGTSTPAERRLHSAYYLFGMRIDDQVSFEQDIWHIYDDIEIDLEVQ